MHTCNVYRKRGLRGQSIYIEKGNNMCAELLSLCKRSIQTKGKVWSCTIRECYNVQEHVTSFAKGLKVYKRTCMYERERTKTRKTTSYCLWLSRCYSFGLDCIVYFYNVVVFLSYCFNIWRRNFVYYYFLYQYSTFFFKKKNVIVTF